MTGSAFLAAGLSDRAAQRLGRSVLVVGGIMVAAGIGAIAAIAYVQARPDTLALIVPLTIAGVGNGLFIAPNVDFCRSRCRLLGRC